MSVSSGFRLFRQADAPFEIMIGSSRSFDFLGSGGQAYSPEKERKRSGREGREGEMLKHLLSTAVTVAGVCTLLLPQSAQDQFKTTYEEIVAAAKREPAVQWCTGLSQKESRPLVAAFKKAYPDVPQVNDFECSGQDATQRVLSEWKARAPQVDILDADDEVLQTLDDQN